MNTIIYSHRRGLQLQNDQTRQGAGRDFSEAGCGTGCGYPHRDNLWHNSPDNVNHIFD